MIHWEALTPALPVACSAGIASCYIETKGRLAIPCFDLILKSTISYLLSLVRLSCYLVLDGRSLASNQDKAKERSV